MLGLGLGPTFQRSALWTPAAAEPTFWLDTRKSTIATGAGSTVTALRDAAGGSLVLGQLGVSALPVLHPNAFGGLSSVRTSLAGGEKLGVVGGPAMGSDIPATIYALAAIYGSPTSTYPVVAALGDPAMGSQKAMALGARSGVGWAAYAQSSPIGASGGTPDTAAHVLTFFYDGTKYSVYVDGLLVAGPTAAGTVDTSTGGFPSGLGIWPAGAGFNGDVDLVSCVWRVGGADSSAVRSQHVAYLGGLGSSPIVLPPRIVASGDSTTFAGWNDAGTGTTADSYIAQLSSQTGMATAYPGATYTNDGHSGATAQQLFGVSTAPGSASALQPKRRGVLHIGYNDIFTSVSPTTTLSYIAQQYAAMTAAGLTVVVCTLYPWIGYQKSAFDTLNNAIRSTYPIVADLASLSALQSGLTLSGGTYAGAYDDVNRCASGSAIGHPTRQGQTIVAAYLAGGGTGYPGLVNL